MKKYNILWIDDEYKKLSSFIIDAELDGIYITPFDTSVAGMEAFEKNILMWDGIILDAKCWSKSSDEVASTEGMYLSLDKITELKHKRYVPIFVFTGQPDLYSDEQFSKSLRGRRFYKKGNEADKKQLFADIMSEADKLVETQIRHKYHRVFEAFSEEIKGQDKVLKIFLTLHGYETVDHTDVYTQLRLILEWMFRDASKRGLLHDKCIDEKGKVNLTESSLFMAGKPTKYLDVYCDIAHFPKIIADNIKSLLEITGGASHTSEPDEKELINLQAYWGQVNTPYLLYSLTFMLCDILIWYKEYADRNSNNTTNKSHWREIAQSDTQLTGKITNITQNGLAFLKPEGSKDSKENCGIQPKLLYNLLGLDTSKLLIVEYEVQKKKKRDSDEEEDIRVATRIIRKFE